MWWNRMTIHLSGLINFGLNWGNELIILLSDRALATAGVVQ